MLKVQLPVRASKPMSESSCCWMYRRHCRSYRAGCDSHSCQNRVSSISTRFREPKLCWNRSKSSWHKRDEIVLSWRRIARIFVFGNGESPLQSAKFQVLRVIWDPSYFQHCIEPTFELDEPSSPATPRLNLETRIVSVLIIIFILLCTCCGREHYSNLLLSTLRWVSYAPQPFWCEISELFATCYEIQLTSSLDQDVFGSRSSYMYEGMKRTGSIGKKW